MFLLKKANSVKGLFLIYIFKSDTILALPNWKYIREQVFENFLFREIKAK